MKLLLSLLFAALAALSQAVPPAQCFPIEQLPAADQEPAKQLFLKLMDSEALYTAIAGVKPMSGGFVTFHLPADSLDVNTVDAARRQLSAFHCGSALFATVHHFARLFPDRESKVVERYYDAILFHRDGMRRTIGTHKPFFLPLGLGEDSHPLEVLMAIEYAEAPTRFEGFGLLFGYPDYAVKFFVDASRKQALTGQFVVRDFVGMPTFARAERGVVYAVEKGSEQRDVDHQFRAKLASILAEYKTRREKFIGDGKPGIIALLRDWFCSGQSCQSPSLP
ncbi:MAG: hypothetical protein FJW36_22540 [Acidobacteria bacterium]|nr:hypothetical protein [Acidobacteriota bacterium]